MTASYEDAQCPYFSASKCDSCGLLGIRQGERLSSKESRVHAALRDRGIVAQHSEAIRTVRYPWGSRCKTKVSVTGSLDAPVLGIVRSDLSTQDLTECPLTPTHVQRLLSSLKGVIKDAKLLPYDIQQRKGELKHIIITHNHDATQGILRFILRSSESIPRIAKCVSAIQSAHPWVTVMSCNVQPIPAALLEGPEETVLTSASTMEVLYNDVMLSFMPQSFIQVTHEIAAALYHRASAYVRENSFSHALDLFCGVGGFSLSIAPSVRKITGVEVSSAAAESARHSASRSAVSHAHFVAEDVESFLKRSPLDDVDLVIVNPPRRGLSTGIRQEILTIAPQSIIYSSCDPNTFARDVEDLCQRYSLTKVAPFDMFPLTDHCEVLGILERN